MTEPSPRDLAEGRRRAYRTLAELIARPPDARLREVARASEGLRAVLDAHAPDDVAAQHEAVFGLDVHPFEGVFLDPSGQVGGATGQRLRATFEAVGYLPDPKAEDPEHLATILRALAFLGGAEVDALEDGEAAVLDRLATLTRRLLDEHLLRWLPVFAHAARQTGHPWPIAVVDQLEAVVLHHRQALGAPWPEPFELAAEALDLDDADTDLRTIGEALVHPPTFGAYLGRHAIAALGRGSRVPRGFGDRKQTMVNLLRSAAQYEAVGPIAEGLRAQLGALEARFEELVGQARWLDAVVGPWRTRREAMEEVLGRLADAAHPEG